MMQGDTLERNSELFEAIADAIELAPERYDQSDWALPGPDDFEGLPTTELLHRCGTKHCIAGWAVSLSTTEDTRNKTKDDVDRRGWGAVARERLGLSFDEADELFGQHWLPRAGMTVPEALRALAAGADVRVVSR